MGEGGGGGGGGGGMKREERESGGEGGYQCLSFGCLLAPARWLSPYLCTPHSPPPDWLWQLLLTPKLPSPFTPSRSPPPHPGPRTYPSLPLCSPPSVSVSSRLFFPSPLPARKPVQLPPNSRLKMGRLSKEMKEREGWE